MQQLCPWSNSQSGSRLKVTFQLIDDKSQPDVESWLVLYIIDFPIDLSNGTMALAAIFIFADATVLSLV